MTAVVLRARPLVIGRIKSCGAIHWTAAMHLVRADSREEAWRYVSPLPSEVFFGDSWDQAVRGAQVTVDNGVDIVRRQLAGRDDVQIVTQATARP